MAFQLQDDQQVELAISYLDAAGNPATVDGSTSWASSDETVLTVEPSADGTSATARAVGPLGTAQVQTTADADLGEGVVAISGVLDVEVIASQAVTATITPGEPS